jgi:hypothetical protein
MSTQVHTERKGESLKLTVEIRVPAGQSMMECEEQIQDAVNRIGSAATRECLGDFDTDGSPISVAGISFTSKGPVSKKYQTPYGEVAVDRHVYQSGWGGATYCPMDRDARVINSTTPRFARSAASKYAAMKSTEAQRDLEENHGRKVSRCYLQDIASDVAAIAQDKQDRWTYEQPPLEGMVHTVGLGVDGTCMLFCEEGYREAMVGTITLYDEQGDRLHTIYVAAAPEYGKQSFFDRMDTEIRDCKKRYPWAYWVGVADGAKDHWPWLKKHTQRQILDFFHASGYLDKAAAGVCARKADRQSWMDQRAHDLKHERGTAGRLIQEMKDALAKRKLGKEVRTGLQRTVGYFENHLKKMNYPQYRRDHLPIGSGVTEAACKTVIKHRMCGSGMKWKSSGAGEVLRLRSLTQSGTRWAQFWQKISRFGI